MFSENFSFLISVLFLLSGARNHVNRMCLAADRPLIESGTAGYLGQVTVIKKVHYFYQVSTRTVFEMNPVYYMEDGLLQFRFF